MSKPLMSIISNHLLGTKTPRIYYDKKVCKRIEFVQVLLEKFNISWTLEPKDLSTNDKDLLGNKCYVFDLSAKILDKYVIYHYNNFRIHVNDIADLTDLELDVKYNITLRTLQCFLERWTKSEINRFKFHIQSKDIKHIDNAREKLIMYFNFKTMSGNIGHYQAYEHGAYTTVNTLLGMLINDDSFNDIFQNLILDGFELEDFPDLDEVL